MHSCALYNIGHLICFGWNEFGQTNLNALNKTKFHYKIVVQVALGAMNTCIINMSGFVECYGRSQS